MNKLFPQIKFVYGDLKDVKHLKRLNGDLRSLEREILSYAPSNFNSSKLKRIRIRVFKFSRKEDCGEMYLEAGRKKYVCLNSSIINTRYYKSLQYILHGIAHSFCHLESGVVEESFCEFVSYSILKKHLEKRGKRFSRRVIRGIIKSSPSEYRVLYKAAGCFDKKCKDYMVKLNVRAKNRKVSKKYQRKIFHKFLKLNKLQSMIVSEYYMPELEKGFRKL